MSRLGAHRGRQAEAHRSQTGAGEERARTLELVVLGRPHLMLADAHGDDRVAVLRQPRERADGVLRQDAGIVLVVRERIGRLPLVDLARSNRRVSSGGSTILFSSARAYFTSLTIGNVGRLVLVDLRGIDVDVHDLGVLGELARPCPSRGRRTARPGPAAGRTGRPRRLAYTLPCMPSMSSESGSSLEIAAQAHHGHGDGNARLADQRRAAPRWRRRRSRRRRHRSPAAWTA